MKIIKYLPVFKSGEAYDEYDESEILPAAKAELTSNNILHFDKIPPRTPYVTVEITITDVETKYLFERQGRELPEREAVNV